MWLRVASFQNKPKHAPGYCEFDGGALAMAMDACDMANSRCGGPSYSKHSDYRLDSHPPRHRYFLVRN